MNKISTLSTEVHVYCRDISISPGDMNLLDEVERARAGKSKFELHRNRFIAAHTALRKILISYLDENPVILKFPQGKPYLKDHPEIQFNLSHSENIALYAITVDTPVGIDVEYNPKSHDFMGIAERFFSPEEFELIKISQDPRTLFLQFWTRKEAYLKLKGSGISEGLDQKIPDNFMIHDFIPASDYTAALVLPRVSKQIVYFGIKF